MFGRPHDSHPIDTVDHPDDERPEATVVVCECGVESVGRNVRQAMAAHGIHQEQAMSDEESTR